MNRGISMKREDKFFYSGVMAIVAAIWVVIYFQWTTILQISSQRAWFMVEVMAVILTIAFFGVWLVLSWRRPKVAHLEHDHKLTEEWLNDDGQKTIKH